MQRTLFRITSNSVAKAVSRVASNDGVSFRGRVESSARSSIGDVQQAESCVDLLRWSLIDRHENVVHGAKQPGPRAIGLIATRDKRMKGVNAVRVWAVRHSDLNDRLRQVLGVWIGRRIVIGTADKVVVG